MTTQDILTAIGLIGIGGLLKSLIDYLISSKKQKSESQQYFKEERYKAILLLCYALVNYDKESTSLVIQRPNLDSREKLYSEINAEWTNMVLFASDKVLKAMKDFLESENKKSYNELILAMRRDLYGIKTKIQAKDFILEKNDK